MTEVLAGVIGLIAAGVCGACLGVMLRRGETIEALTYLALIAPALILVEILTN